MLRTLALALMLTTTASAQQMVPLTDWRLALDTDLSKVSMPRDAHSAIFNILQAYERQAQSAKTPPALIEPPK